MHLDTRKCYIFRDVIFVENTFPFHTLNTPDSSLFPSPSVYTESCTDSPLAVIPSDHISLSEPEPITTSAVDNLNVVPSTRRSGRTKNLPSKFKDFTGLPPLVSNTAQPSSSSVCTYPLSHYISYHVFRAPHVAFLTNITNSPVPYTFKQAIVHKHWSDAMSAEILALESNQTWEIVPKPAGKNIVDCKWLFKVKYTPEGTIDKYKARVVAKGFTQTIGVDYC